MFFVEARYHHSPKRAADQVRYIAHREIGLQGGEHRELYGIGARYRAFRGDEKAIGKALIDDARGHDRRRSGGRDRRRESRRRRRPLGP